MDEKILTPDQVAQILQVHPFTVLKFIKQGKLRASRLGRVYRIRESDVNKFLDEQEAAAASKSYKTTPKEADMPNAPDENPAASPTESKSSKAPKKGSKKVNEDQNLLEAEETTPEPEKESFVPSIVSKKKEQQGTPNQSRTDEMDHYILD
jgi:excisionase family DNA binding protein